MDISHVKSQLDQFLDSISKNIKVEQMIIFGSYVHGETHPDSDLDVIVVSDDFGHIREDKRIGFLDNAAEDIQPIIQAWGVTHQELRLAGKQSILGSARDHGYQAL